MASRPYALLHGTELLDWSFTYRVREARQVYMAGVADWYRVSLYREVDGSMRVETSANYSNREELFAAALVASLDSDPVKP
jgi:hypothetical protein